MKKFVALASIVMIMTMFVFTDTIDVNAVSANTGKTATVEQSSGSGEEGDSTDESEENDEESEETDKPEATVEPEETEIPSEEPEATETPSAEPEATESPVVTPAPPTETPAPPTETPTPSDNSKIYDSYFKKVTMTKSVTRAVGTKYQLKLNNMTLSASKYKLSFKTSDSKKATVDSKGNVTMKAAGNVKITATVKCDNNAVYTYICSIKVTNPKFSSSKYFVRPNGTVNIKVTGGSTSKYKVNVSNTKIIKKVSSTSTKVKGVKSGKSKVSVTIDGKTISCYVYVSKPKLNYTDLFIVKGKSLTLKVTGHSKATSIAYSSSDKSVATVSKTGKITTKKNGSCVITATVDGKKLTCYVAVSNKRVINTLKQAYGALGKTYSQAKRMKKNYYDCSSLVWRCYSKNGVKFGNSSYAPTAAAQAYHMVKTKKVLYTKGVSYKKLLPGDVLFVKNSTYNGRYKNIGHVVIYIGNGRILHATPPKVMISDYSKYLNNKKNPYVLMTRPTK